MQQLLEHFLLGLFFMFHVETIIRVFRAPSGHKLLSLFTSICLIFVCTLVGYLLKLASGLF